MRPDTARVAKLVGRSALGLTACLLLSLPVASFAANNKKVHVHTSVTLQRLDDQDWQLYVENSGGSPVAISWVTWTAPTGLKVDRITNSLGGRCMLAHDGSLQCRTQLAPPRCPTCEGEGLTVNFKGSGFEGQWIKTSYGGYWLQFGWQPGGVAIIASPPFADLPTCTKGQASTKSKPCAAK